MAERKIDTEPRVGIFFIIDKKIHYIWEPISLYDGEKEYIDSSYSHYDFFWHLKSKYPELQDEDREYEEFSRGRVVYHLKEKTFYIFGDPIIIKDPKYYKRLLKCFNLTNQKVEVGDDEHYIRTIKL